jgi:hypothetical protein
MHESGFCRLFFYLTFDIMTLKSWKIRKLELSSTTCFASTVHIKYMYNAIEEGHMTHISQ